LTLPFATLLPTLILSPDAALAFQNCHRLAAFRPDAVTSPAYLDFISVRSQILNQTPALVDC